MVSTETGIERRKSQIWIPSLRGKKLLPALVVFFTVASALVAVSISFRHADVFKVAVEKARVHETVISELGEPIDIGLFVTGRIRNSTPMSSAELTIPLQGPRGKGRLRVKAKKLAGEHEWGFKYLSFHANGVTTINILR